MGSEINYRDIMFFLYINNCINAVHFPVNKYINKYKIRFIFIHGTNCFSSGGYHFHNLISAYFQVGFNIKCDNCFIFYNQYFLLFHETSPLQEVIQYIRIK